MTEFEIGENTYFIGKLSAMKQFHITSKLSLALITLGNMQRQAGSEPSANAFAQVICAMSADLSQQDREMAIGECLAVVSRRPTTGGAWAPIRAGNGAIMFDDIDVATMLQIAWKVMERYRLPDFFSASPAISTT